ncbi:ribonuclease H-like domain-containing protein [Luteimonas huabeiensis]|uniref:ribonuclease H-like domain-containing protein n=1 Tax=Luteimonas huabeiensis TaxID=1244513 RepID=UPI00046454CF|nr:ribonuclease H-like domain-containing protein [Luteimonas huabeiensis]
MSALASRLAGLRRQAGGSVPSRPAPPSRSPVPPTPPMSAAAPARRADPAAQLRRLLDLRPQPALRPAPAADRALPGEEIAPGLRYLEQRIPWEGAGEALPLHGIGQGEVARARVLAFDTETTGLAGGTGTRAFMIGAADWRDGGLRLRQLTIATLAAERAMLAAFAGWIGADTVLLSYNGKSYDRPLLSTRYRLARMADPLPACGHIDLLHPMRRRYRNVWPNCRLATAERQLLGVLREDDLPGAEAPAAWLHYLRGGSAAKLRRVGLHNAQDLRSLCGLLEALADAS